MTLNRPWFSELTLSVVAYIFITIFYILGFFFFRSFDEAWQFACAVINRLEDERG